MLEKQSFSKTIGFITAGLTFNGDTVKEKSLGGSETALLYMASNLQKLGNNVVVFCNCDKPGEYDGVDYIDLKHAPNYAKSYEFDVLIVSRFYEFLPKEWRTAIKVLWNHDVPTNRVSFMEQIYDTDIFFCLSDYHVDLYSKEYLEIEPYIAKSANGLDYTMIKRTLKKSITKDPNKIIYAARPERGLNVLLESVFPRLKKMRPNLKLYIAGYDLGNFPLNDETKQLYAYLDRLIANTPDVVNLGSLPKKEYYRHLAEATAYVYPTAFPEIFCLSAAESQALGTPFICTDDFALSETVKIDDWKLKGNNADPEFQAKFTKLVLDWLCPDTEKYQKAVKKAQKAVAQYDWARIAREWNDLFETSLYNRFTRNTERTIKNMFWHSDYVHGMKMLEMLDESSPELAALKEEGQKVLDSNSVFRDEYDELTEDEWDALKDPNVLFRENYAQGRFAAALTLMADEKAKLLDIGTRYGEFPVWLSARRPDYEITAVDISEKCLGKAKELTDLIARGPERINYEVCSWDEIEKQGEYDYVFAGELIEHVIDTKLFLEKIQSYAKPGGRIVITAPSGPWESVSFGKRDERFHVHHFQFNDFRQIFYKVKGLAIRHMTTGLTERGEMLGNWIITWIRDDKNEFREVDTYRKCVAYRPYESIGACLITKNEEENIIRCINSFKGIVDEVHVLDTGSTDKTVELAKYAGADVRVKTWSADEGGFNFGKARNESKNGVKTDWIFWIDADEILVYGTNLRRYLNGRIYNAFVITQNHLILDVQMPPDVPNRIFRNNSHYRFNGMIHEHPEDTTNRLFDDPIVPNMILKDVKIVHYGYTTEDDRREKCGYRNLPLLLEEMEQHPDRMLSKVLFMRDCINLTNWTIEKHGGVTQRELNFLYTILDMYKSYGFKNPEHQYYRLATPFYQQALEILGKMGIPTRQGVVPFQVSFALGAGVGGLKTDPKSINPHVVWFESEADYKDYLSRKVDALATAMNLPKRPESEELLDNAAVYEAVKNTGKTPEECIGQAKK